MTGTVIPVIPARNWAESLSYYTDFLGFRADWIWDKAGHFAQLSRAGLKLYLSDDEHIGGPQRIYLYVPDVDAWYLPLSAADPTLAPPVNTAWRNRECTLTDPAGNTLVLATPVSRLRRT
ncbi:glyoxalase superfamily protein [Hahella sp. SMD15-11]|uniref:Glyoxalase superfamily protein n=1 Tax=Thermohahella caldifontis TaxID=3142973 RepID=A0AB39UUH2_9GAMM